MKRIFLVLTALAVSGCAGTYKTTFDHEAAPEPISIHVVPVVAKEEMDVQIVVADSSAATGQFGLIGGLVGAIIDSAMNKRAAIEAERRAEILRDLTVEYDLLGAAHQSTLRVGNDDRWKILTVEEPVTTVGWDDAANDAFESGDAAAVAVLDFDFAMTPLINQVRVHVDQRIYLRSDEKKSKRNRKPQSLRSFTYYSPVHALVTRPYNDGEKEALVDAVKSGYAERMVAHPEEAEDLQKSMEAELEDLEESTVIPEPVSFRETWTAEMLTSYLDQSIDHIAFMLRHDWEAATVPEEEVRTEDEFLIVNANGMTFKDKGKNVARLDQNTVFRSQWGNIYSVPVDE